jgi:hypothetical protein
VRFPIVMPLIFLLLLLLPIRLTARQLSRLAFALWLVGGVFLLSRGALWLFGSGETTLMLGVGTVLALAIGFAKGKFVLSKTSNRNIERLCQLTEPQRPIHVYSVRSWVTIGIMVLISVSLWLFQVPDFWRGSVNLAVGAALIMSSLVYLTHPQLATQR